MYKRESIEINHQTFRTPSLKNDRIPTAAFTTVENHIAPQPLDKRHEIYHNRQIIYLAIVRYRSCVMPKTPNSLWTRDLVGGHAGILRWGFFLFFFGCWNGFLSTRGGNPLMLMLFNRNWMVIYPKLRIGIPRPDRELPLDGWTA